MGCGCYGYHAQVRAYQLVGKKWRLTPRYGTVSPSMFQVGLSSGLVVGYIGVDLADPLMLIVMISWIILRVNSRAGVVLGGHGLKVRSLTSDSIVPQT